MGTAFGLPQIASLYDPGIAVDQAALDRQTQLAQLLRAQAMTPIDTQGRQIGGMGYKISPLEGVAKVLQGYEANKQFAATDQQRLDLQQRMMAGIVQALRSGLPGDQPQGAPTAAAAPQGAPAPDAGTSTGAPQGAPQAPQGTPASAAGNAFTLPALLRGNIIEGIGGQGMGNAYAKNFETPEAVRTLTAEGQDPTAVGNLTTKKLAKEANAPTRLGNGLYADAAGTIHGIPQAVEGAINIPDPTAPGGFKSVPVPGAAGNIEAGAGATALGKAQGVPFSGVDANGQPLPVTSLADVLRRRTSIPADVQSNMDAKRIGILKDELSKATDPADIAAIQKELGGMQGGTALIDKPGVYAAPPLGTSEAQASLDKKWEALQTQDREAGNTKSYLQNIVTAAKNGAIVGPGADRREMIQGVLQLAGIDEKANTNAIDQTTLLNKYHNQIVTRLSQSGLGTDAARAMLDSAYPGNQMNVGAIQEAAANLNGAQDMVQAKTRFLQDAGAKRNSTAYQQREIQFDQAADPRIWQFKNIQDPAARSAFAKQVLQQDPSFPKRIQALESMGAL